MERGVEQTDRHAVAVHDGHAMFEVFLGEVVDGVESFLGFGFVIAKQNFLNVRQTLTEEHVLCTEQANAAGTLVEGRLCFGGFSIGAFFYVRRAIATRYARLSALCPAGIRSFAPGYVLDRCAVCAHTPGATL